MQLARLGPVLPAHLDGDPDAVGRLSDLLLAPTPAPGAAALQASGGSGR